MATLMDELEVAAEPRYHVAVIDPPLRELSDRAADVSRLLEVVPAETEAERLAPETAATIAPLEEATPASQPVPTEKLFNATAVAYPLILIGLIGIAAFNFLILLAVVVWMSLGGKAI